jgi:hypothetical protein
MKLLIAASVVLAVAPLPAQAAIPVPVMKVMGADFYTRCTNPPADRGTQVVSLCAAYVAGIADDLIDARQVCLAPGVTPPKLLPYALNWMRIRRQNGAYPAAMQIRTGLVTLFPCKRVTRTVQNEQMSLGDAIKLGTQFYQLWKEVLPAVLAIIH